MENLAAKYRPETLDEIVGQNVVVDIVKNTCGAGEVTNRNFLFIGPSGTGKTTTARAIARILNEGKGEPIEVDAASHSGVESVRTLIEQMRIHPVGTKYKVFILDECFHGSSKVATPEGSIDISCIESGQEVYGLGGIHKVVHTFENKVPTTNLLLVHTNKGPILTTKSHLFMTTEGWIEGQDLKEGDLLYAKRIDNLCDMRKGVSSACVRSSKSMREGMRRGYEEASIEGIPSELSTNWLQQTVSNMREKLLHSEERECYNLFKQVWEVVDPSARTFGEAARLFSECQVLIYMSDMWKARNDIQVGTEKILFSQMLSESKISKSSTAGQGENGVIEAALCYMWKRIHSKVSDNSNLFKGMQVHVFWEPAEREEISRIVASNEDEQSNEQSGCSQENARNKREERNIAQALCSAWWEWLLHPAAAFDISEHGSRMDVRICCNNSCEEERQSESLSLQLQSRPWTARYSISSRGGWSRPQYEIAEVARSEERGVFERTWVDSIEIYQSGYNDESFRNYFDNSELRSGFVTLYDLEVDGHPSYYVNGILVHNCHSFSSNAWQALLKTIEEQPAKTINCFCTTNPEKIPPTILSRVQTFQLSKISLDGIYNRLKYIIEQENKEGRRITYTDDAILFLAKSAQGGMRDGITSLDQCLAYSNDITVENVMKALDLPSYDDYFDLLNAIAKKDNSTIVDMINTVYNSGVNFVKWFDGFFSFVTNIVKFIYLQDIQQTMIPSIYQDKIAGYGVAHSALCLKLSNKLVKMNQELKTTQYLQELAISYLCTVPVMKKG